MGRPRNPVPKYSLHKPTGQAYCRVGGKPVYLGKHGTPASKDAYRRLLAELPAAPDAPAAPPPTLPRAGGAVVSDLAAAFVGRELAGYSGSEAAHYRAAVACVVEAADAGGSVSLLAAGGFSTRHLLAVRDAMVRRGWTREHVNAQVRRVRAVFRWGELAGLVPVGKWHELRSLPGLKKSRDGRGPREQRKVEPVPDADVERTTPQLTPTVSAMVLFQRLTGCRPQDVCRLTPGRIDRSDPAVWVYRPEEHKGAHRGQSREVYVGPKAQAVLGPHLDWARPDAAVFSPRAAAAEHSARRRAARRPAHPSQVKERQQAERGVSLRVGEWYTTHSYSLAIERAAARAGVPHWAPGQLRHAAGTEFRDKYGLDAAQRLLGHKEVRTTQRYAKIVDATAVDAAKDGG